MKTRRGNDRRPWREKTVGTLTAGCFLLYLIALSPHLVHHLFEKDHDSPTCPFLALNQHTPELQPDPPPLTPLSLTGPLDEPKRTASLPVPLIHGSHPRAPPRSVPPT
jgi:hypothetical protein